MGMSTRVKGYRSSEEHDKHIRVWNMCKAENVSLPQETAAYFGRLSKGVNPEDIDQDTIEELLEVNISSAVVQYSKHCTDYWEVDLTKLPSNATKIIFENSY